MTDIGLNKMVHAIKLCPKAFVKTLRKFYIQNGMTTNRAVLSEDHVTVEVQKVRKLCLVFQDRNMTLLGTAGNLFELTIGYRFPYLDSLLPFT